MCKAPHEFHILINIHQSMPDNDKIALFLSILPVDKIYMCKAPQEFHILIKIHQNMPDNNKIVLFLSILSVDILHL